MKNAPTTNSNESALDKCNYNAGTLPKRTNTVTASVLAYLLENHNPTGMEAVFKMSTTRLAAFIHYLGKKYDWVIERNEIVTGTNDGRIATITVYWFPQATIAHAFKCGARDWVSAVCKASTERRKQSQKCKAIAHKINASRNKPSDPRQATLWGAL
jgi:hypothetical protein